MGKIVMGIMVIFMGGCASTQTTGGGGEFERIRRRHPYKSYYQPVQVWLEDELETVCLPTDGRCS